jgi:phenylacetate-coenzyme A ligase PaaK-like adenylate-forming protein
MFVLSLLNAHREGLMVERRARDRLEALQRRKFRALVEHCLASSAYYRDIIADLGINPERCEVEDFPVLDKSTVIANFDRIATHPAVTWPRISAFAASGGDDETLMDGRFHIIHTSGSSGETGYFVFSNDEWARGLAPALRINPYRGRRRRLAFYGIVNDHGAGAGMAMTSNQGLLRLAYDARGFDILKPVDETVAEIDAFKPDIIVGYPTAIYQLADAQRAGRMNIAPQFLQCSGEVVFPEHRQAIEQAFGRPLFNVYSSSEHLIMGMSRGGGEDMMLFEENFVFEQNEDHTLVTNLYNYTLPLIRYRMNDRLIPAGKPATDRHPYRRVKEIVGRAEGGDLVFRRPDGREERITSFAFGSLMWRGVERIQFHVGNDRCRLDLVPEPGLDAAGVAVAVDEARAKLRDLFASRSLHHVEVSVRAVGTIEPDPATGKVRAVVTIPDTHDPGLAHFPAEQAA